jgi:NAD(P)-dependent dehydrogenase (short-subunit alcohol dehydrogenase family)
VERLADAVAVVTGAASGIGAACVERLAAEGATVVTVDIVGPVDHLVDVRDEAGVADIFDTAVSAHGKVDVLVHAAGVAGGGPVHLLDGEEWNRVIDINLKGTFIVDKHSSRVMLAAGKGSIINIASIEGIEGIEGTEGGSVYNASKGGVVTLTKSMAIDYGRRGIRVNCICPGGIDTPLLQAVTGADGMGLYRDTMRDAHLLGRFRRPDEIAAAAAFLASEDASFITGHALVVDGGSPPASGSGSSTSWAYEPGTSTARPTHCRLEDPTCLMP